jgi:DNA-binding NarL/FixJ family response regulator
MCNKFTENRDRGYHSFPEICIMIDSISLETASTILVVDDHELVLRGISEILSKTFPTADILTASTGDVAMRYVSQKHIDLVTVDLELPDMSGFVLIDLIRAKSPETKILVNTIHDEIWTIKRLAKRSVEGIIFKSARALSFVEAVSQIVEGGTYYDQTAQSLMKSIELQNVEEAGLTVREVEVLRLIADGLNTEEIGARLFLSPNTIETHRRHLLEKLNARNAAELVRRAISAGIISPIE